MYHPYQYTYRLWHWTNIHCTWSNVKNEKSSNEMNSDSNFSIFFLCQDESFSIPSPKKKTIPVWGLECPRNLWAAWRHGVFIIYICIAYNWYVEKRNEVAGEVGEESNFLFRICEVFKKYRFLKHCWLLKRTDTRFKHAAREASPPPQPGDMWAWLMVCYGQVTY